MTQHDAVIFGELLLKFVVQLLLLEHVRALYRRFLECLAMQLAYVEEVEV